MTEYVVHDQVVYWKLGDEVHTSEPYGIRVQVGRPLDSDEAEQLAGLVGYAYASTGGERGNGYTQDTPNSIIYHCDTTKGRAYRRLDSFFLNSAEYIVNGSPKRKTKGDTRLVEGLGPVGEISFWADNVLGLSPEDEALEELIREGGTPDSDSAPDAVPDDSEYDEFGFNAEGVHRNGTLLDDNGRDVTGDAFGEAPLPVDPDEDRVSRTKTGDVVKFKFRAGEPVSVQKLHDEGGKPKWGPPRSTRTGTGKSTLQGVEGLNPSARAVPASVASRYASATGTCLLCSRPLTDTTSQARGYGPECASKVYNKDAPVNPPPQPTPRDWVYANLGRMYSETEVANMTDDEVQEVFDLYAT